MGRANGQEPLTLKGHTRVPSAAFSPDGSRIVTGSDDHTAKVWDARSGQDTLTLKGHTKIVTAVAFSPDGKKIGYGKWDKTVKVWNAQTGQQMLKIKGHTKLSPLFLLPGWQEDCHE